MHFDGDEAQDPPVPEGAELLDNHERQYLSSFFECVNGFESNLFNNVSGALFTDHWRFPPELVGHNVSYGTAGTGLVEAAFPNLGVASSDREVQESSTSPSSSSQAQQQQQPQLRLADQQTPADVLAAATALSRSSGAQFGMLFGASPSQQTLAHISQQPVGLAQHHGYAGSGSNHNSQPSSSHDRPDLLNRMVFNAIGSGESSYSQSPRPPVDEVRFGSDPSFNNRVNFVPRSEKETTEAMMAQQLATLGCLERNVSAAPSRAQSPTSWTPPSPKGAKSSLFSSKLRTMSHDPLTPDEPENHDSGRPKKRRRSTKTGDAADADEDDEPTPSSSLSGPGARMLTAGGNASSSATPGSRAQKPPGPLTPDDEAAANTTAGGTTTATTPAATTATTTTTTATTNAATAKKRRRSVTGGATRAPRENLTEAQKRQNHIRSEQKRRNIIKSGFNELVAIVPALKGGGYSKAAMLNMTAEWLADVIAGNERLRGMLRRCEEAAAGAVGAG